MFVNPYVAAESNHDVAVADEGVEVTASDDEEAANAYAEARPPHGNSYARVDSRGDGESAASGTSGKRSSVLEALQAANREMLSQ
jgi:hypothetical protein